MISHLVMFIGDPIQVNNVKISYNKDFFIENLFCIFFLHFIWSLNFHLNLFITLNLTIFVLHKKLNLLDMNRHFKDDL